MSWIVIAFLVIALIGVIATAWYAYVLWGKATDLFDQMAVVGKRLGKIAELVAEIKFPEMPAEGDDATPKKSDTPAKEKSGAAKDGPEPARAKRSGTTREVSAERDAEVDLDADVEDELDNPWASDTPRRAASGAGTRAR
ncbi:hypothetical protein [Microlunatus sp. Y2014]|uniref:hypothetical protein n=1 Tax=Microlunatus sp. Y2014 TaxID=3418488 RepID=UPI003DA71B51